jgi:hypothetical protein
MSEALKKRAAMLALWLVCMPLGAFSAVRMLWAAVSNPAKAFDLAKGFDLLGNVAFNGALGELISSRAGKQQRQGRRWACVLCRLLDYIERDHCEKNIQPNVGDPVPPKTK